MAQTAGRSVSATSGLDGRQTASSTHIPECSHLHQDYKSRQEYGITPERMGGELGGWKNTAE
jgi:hypothetical protein